MSRVVNTPETSKNPENFIEGIGLLGCYSFTDEFNNLYLFRYDEFIAMAEEVIDRYLEVEADVVKVARYIFDQCEGSSPYKIVENIKWKNKFENNPQEFGIDFRTELEICKEDLGNLLEQMEDKASKLSSKGDTTADCQRLLILTRIGDLYSAINGLEERDFFLVES